MVDFENRLKDVVADRVETQIQQVCPKFYNKHINSRTADKGYNTHGDVIGYYTKMSQDKKDKLDEAENMFLDDIIKFYKTEIKLFKKMNTRFEDKFAKYIVLSFV